MRERGATSDRLPTLYQSVLSAFHSLPRSSQGSYELDSFYLLVTDGETEAQKAKQAAQCHGPVGGGAGELRPTGLGSA